MASPFVAKSSSIHDARVIQPNHEDLAHATRYSPPLTESGLSPVQITEILGVSETGLYARSARNRAHPRFCSWESVVVGRCVIPAIARAPRISGFRRQAQPGRGPGLSGGHPRCRKRRTASNSYTSCVGAARHTRLSPTAKVYVPGVMPLA